MRKLPQTRTESEFADFKAPYTPQQALVEANRCLFCHDAPCITACPTAIDIPQFIRKIATGNVHGSAKTIFASNILGMSCARVCPVEVLCVGSCVYNEMGVPPIQIGKLQRYSTDIAYEEGWRYGTAGADTGKSVGLVGAGPASLACAYELRLRGHAVTIYEGRDYAGGLNTTGVAPYKMLADRAIEEVEWITAIGGIEIRTGVLVGRDVSWADLEAAHDALFLGLGLGADKLLRLPGAELEGIHGAVDYIERFKCGSVDLAGIHDAVVLGGGNTAIDCVRELCGLGVPKVTMVYRGNEGGMSGYAHEWEAAKVEGAHGLWHRQPVGYVGDGGSIAGVVVARTDDDRRVVDGTEHTIDADLVLLAVGQERLSEAATHLEGIALDWGRIVVDEDGATGRPGVYAGGDCANGGKEVVNAAAEGKRAAMAIDRFVTGGGAHA